MANPHAYLCAGGAEVLPAIRAQVEREGIEWEQNPDIYVREYVHFGADDARDIRDRAFTRAIFSSKRVFVIIAPVMTNEAQNALLKTLEEPPAGALFFLVVPSPHALLPTLRSRAEFFNAKGEHHESSDSEAFLKAAPKARLDLLKPLYDHGDDERDLRGASTFLSSLERALAVHTKQDSYREGFRALYRARRYMNDKGALLKVLLENVALALPRV